MSYRWLLTVEYAPQPDSAASVVNNAYDGLGMKQNGVFSPIFLCQNCGMKCAQVKGCPSKRSAKEIEGVLRCGNVAHR
jgi:hypothetical protein